jgi:hypothetical protein
MLKENTETLSATHTAFKVFTERKNNIYITKKDIFRMQWEKNG